MSPSLAGRHLFIMTQGCLDDSDCVPLGHKFACFFYQCLNWVDK